MKEKQKQLNIIAGILGAVLLIVVLWGLAQGKNPLHMEMDDGIQQIDLDTIYLKNSGVEVNFSDVIVSGQHETRKLIVSTQEGKVTTKLTDRLIKIGRASCRERV